MRTPLRFAHIVGTPSHNDPLPGLEDHRESSSAISDLQLPAGQAIVVRFNNSAATEPLRRLLLHAACCCRESWEAFRRLWLPKNSVVSKFRYQRHAFARPQDVVMLDGSTQRMLRAKESGEVDTQNLAYRPKPKFRTREPGVGTIIGFNFLFVLWLFYGSW